MKQFTTRQARQNLAHPHDHVFRGGVAAIRVGDEEIEEFACGARQKRRAGREVMTGMPPGKQ